MIDRRFNLCNVQVAGANQIETVVWFAEENIVAVDCPRNSSVICYLL
jgi:hypothetical protein